MRFLVDENLSPLVADALTVAGHPSQHVRDRGLRGGSDDAVLALAATERLARTNVSAPSVVLLRRQGERRARSQATLILANLPTVEADLEQGAVVVLDDARIRIRSLPLLGGR